MVTRHTIRAVSTNAVAKKGSLWHPVEFYLSCLMDHGHTSPRPWPLTCAKAFYYLFFEFILDLGLNFLP
jgi:hypothetical protein